MIDRVETFKEVERISDKLEEIIPQEVSILRSILNNLKQEQHALYLQDLVQVDRIREERLRIYQPLEGLSEEVKSLARQLAVTLKKKLPGNDDFSHKAAVEWLNEWVPCDQIELKSQLDQLSHLVRGVQTQNDVTEYFLRLKPLEEVTLPIKKNTLALLEHP